MVGNYIGWELLSIGNLFCWFQLVGNLFCFEQAGITGYVLGKNVYRRKKLKKKIITYSRVFQNPATRKPKVGTWGYAAKIGSIVAFLYKNAAIDLSLCVVEIKGWEL